LAKKKKGNKTKPLVYEKIDCIYVDHEGTMAIYVTEGCKGDSHYLKGKKVVYRYKCLECPYRDSKNE
jgi:hypothetical protein